MMRMVPEPSLAIKVINAPPGTGFVCCRSICVLHLSNFLYQKYLLEGEALFSHSSSHCRNLTSGKVHTDKMMHNPIHISPVLESSCLLGIHIGAPAIGRTTSSQRGMEGFQMIRMHLCGGKRLGRVGMLWIRGLILGAFAPALMPL